MRVLPSFFAPRSALIAVSLLLPALAIPAELPSIDTPLKTGLKASNDAAVVIGVEDYKYLPPAPFAGRDADAMYSFLLYTRGVPASRVTLLQGGTSRRKVEDAVAAAGQLVGPGATMWVYFAGHGTASPTTKERLLLPENTLAEDAGFDEAGIPVAELQRLAGAGGGDVMVITDACFTGAGRDGGRLLSGGRSFVPASASASGKAVQWDAALANQVAGPLEPVQHGAFTYFAIGAMRGWADGQVSGTRDGVVTSEEAQLYVDSALKSVGIRDQVPSLVGATAYTRTLATGAKERAPELSAFTVGESGTRRDEAGTPVAPGMSGTQFGGGSGQSVSAKLARQKCDDAARGEADAAHAKKLAAAVAKVQASATARWKAMEPDSTSCLELRAAADRESCAKDLDSFASTARTAKASLTAHTEVISTDCGSIERAFEAETASVSVPEVAKAEALAAKSRVAPAAGASLSVSASSAGSSGQDWTSPTVGLMKYIPAGTFVMGSPESEEGHQAVEVQHKVTLTRPFLMMEHEVTQGEWQAVMGSNPVAMGQQFWAGAEQGPCKTVGVGDELPVACVSWDEAQSFVKKVSARDRASYRLPTEAEWEYAARGGGEGMYAGGGASSLCRLGNVGNVSRRDRYKSELGIDASSWTLADCDDGYTGLAPVGRFAANGYGLFDMTGNVFEWTEDRYGEGSSSSARDPTGASAGSYRVLRGGSWGNSPASARVAIRNGGTPDNRRDRLGLRLARAL